MMKILLLVDVIGWYFDITAKALKKHLPQYDITIKLQNDYIQDDLNKYDYVHCFSWIESPIIEGMGGTTVASHGFEQFHFSKATKNLPTFSCVTALSQNIFTQLENRNLNKNIYMCKIGVDEEVFFPKEDINKDSSKFVVGWVGKETHGGFDWNVSKYLDMKGYENVLIPLKERMSKYKDIEFLINKSHYMDMTPNNDMPDLYNKMDLFICTAFTEGGPLPLFEASACGIPIISTSVGCAKEYIQNKKNGFLLKSYRNKEQATNLIDEFEKTILFMRNNRDLCKTMGAQNRDLVLQGGWTWKNRAKEWIPVFENNKHTQKKNR